jgi:hypothetical protein
VETVPAGPSGGLNAIGAIWVMISLLGGVVMMLGGGTAEGSSGTSFAIGAAVILQGFLFGFSAMALATMVPRRPKPR